MEERVSLLSFKRISWCGRGGAGKRRSQGEQRDETKAQLLFRQAAGERPAAREERPPELGD